jgi:hypothetical protein
VKPVVPVLVAVASLVGARAVRELAAANRPAAVSVPYAPSPAAAPLVSLGYRELAADLLFIRFVGYYGSEHNAADAIAALAEALVALDSRFRRGYELGAVAMGSARTGVDNAIHLRAIALLERGMREFPQNYKLPKLAGEIYLVDLQTTDPDLRREWDQRGALLLESASRKPNAPAEAAVTSALMQTKIGQTERAIENLRELLLITQDARARERIVEQLAKITEDNRDEIAAELLEAREQFDRRWHAVRPAVPPAFYILLGPPLDDAFDLEELAIGGREPSFEPIERLEPLE